LTILVLNGCTKSNENKDEIIFITIEQPIEVKYGVEPDLLSDTIILETNGTVATKNNIDVFEEGVQTVTYTVEKDGIEKAFNVDFLVQDQQDVLYVYESILPSGNYYKCSKDTDNYYNYVGIMKNNKIVYLYSNWGIEMYERYLNENKKIDDNFLSDLILLEGTTNTFIPQGEGDSLSFFVTDEALYYLGETDIPYSGIEKEILNNNFEHVSGICQFELQIP